VPPSTSTTIRVVAVVVARLRGWASAPSASAACLVEADVLVGTVWLLALLGGRAEHRAEHRLLRLRVSQQVCGLMLVQRLVGRGRRAEGCRLEQRTLLLVPLLVLRGLMVPLLRLAVWLLLMMILRRVLVLVRRLLVLVSALIGVASAGRPCPIRSCHAPRAR